MVRWHGLVVPVNTVNVFEEIKTVRYKVVDINNRNGKEYGARQTVFYVEVV